MSKTRMIGGVSVSLGSEPPWMQYIPSKADSEAVAVLHLESVLSLHVKDTPPEALRSLAATFTELAQWREEQLAAKNTDKPGGAP